MIDATTMAGSFKAACVAAKGPDYCTDKVVQVLMAVSRHETCFSGCKPFLGVNNFGAIQCGVVADKTGKCPGGCIPARDTSPTSTGASVSYLACFEARPSAESGVRRFVELMTVKRPLIANALPSGDALQIAWAMRKSYYFEGFGKTQEERVNNYAAAIARNAQLNAAQLRVTNQITYQPPPPPEPPPVDGDMLAGGVLTVAALWAGMRARILSTPETP